MTDELRTHAVKAVDNGNGEWVLEVLGNPWGGPNGGRDSDGEYFDQTTKFHEDKFGLPPAVYYHGYDPDNGRPSGEPQYIGQTVAREVRQDGVWYRVVLDKASQFARRVWEAAQRGIARASSGSNHLHRVDKDGHIREWPVTELSIFDAVGKRQPANAYAVALPAMKAVYQAAGLPLPVDIEPDAPKADAEGAAATVQSANAEQPATEPDVVKTGERVMEPNDIKSLIAEALKADREQREQEAQAAAAKQKEIEDAVKAEREKWEKETGRLPDGAPLVAKFADTRPYDNTETADLAFAAGLLTAAKSRARSNRGLSEAGFKALALRFTEGKEDEHRDVKAAMKMAGVPMKANELNQSTLASNGDEWAGVAYSRELWQSVSANSGIVGKLPTIEVPQGVESVVIPTQSTPPVFYKVAQASAQDSNTLGKATYTHTSSKMGTAGQTLAVGKLGARSIFTAELEEDSVLPWAAELRRAMEQEALAVLESLVIDGDTVLTATTNINDIGGTPDGTEYFLVLNGFRKLALVTNTANSRAAGTLELTDYLETLKLMGLGGKNAVNPNAVGFIVDLHTHWKSLELAEVLTRDVYAQPTIEKGALVNIYGRELIATPNMHRANADATYGLKANSAGKLDLDTAANNIYGSILAVRWDQWRLGWKRRIKFDVVPVPQADATEIVCNMRVGMINRDTEASAISYGVTLA